MVTIEHRDVYIARGKGKSDTVNICDANNRRGQYDWTVRIFKPTNVNEAEIGVFASINDLVEWLKSERDGVVEERPDKAQSDTCVRELPKLAATDFEPPQDAWTQEAKWLVEHCLDQLVHEFIEFPYMHRVEHSLHTRFFSMLSALPHFSRMFEIGKSGIFTQTVHKEWPETKPREARIRGNFDIAVIAPAQLAKASLDEFQEGRIAAPIVLEMGLDYDVAHLAGDEEKLINSEVPYPYLVHFLRDCRHDDRIERILLQPSGNIRTVYARTLRHEVFYKCLNDKTLLSKRSQLN